MQVSISYNDESPNTVIGGVTPRQLLTESLPQFITSVINGGITNQLLMK